MSKVINCIVDTNNKKEREELINYICKDNLAIAITNDIDGFQLIVVSAGIIGNIGVITAHDLVDNKGYKHFLYIEEYKNYVELKDKANA